MMKKLVGMLAFTTLAACGLEESVETETATESVTQAITSASNSSDAPELANLMRGPKGFRFAAAEGFRCDDTPDITYVDVCGQSLPSTVHLEWTDCAAPQKPARGAGQDGGVGAPPPSGHGHDGGYPPPPPPPHGGKGGKGKGPRQADGGMPPPPPPPPGGGLGGLAGRGHGPSSGIIDLSFTYDTDCTGNIEQTQTATFDISRTAADGTVSRSEGTANSVAELVPDARPLVKSTSIDATYSVTEADGTVVRSIDIVGTRSVAFSSDEPPTRTINSTWTETYADGTTASVTEVDVVRPPMDECPWPTSGTQTRTKADGTSHTLVYGPTCGEATLDGVAVDLSERRTERQARRGNRRP